MATELETVDVRNRRRWRAWLEKHHATSTGIWLVFHKSHTGIESIPLDEAIREALCFGWIDSLIKRLDDDRYARKFTPRKSKSTWSDINRKHWKELKAAGLLAEAGLAAAPTARAYAPRPLVAKAPASFFKTLKKDARAWRAFQALAPSHQRHYVLWIYSAVKPETQAKRLAESIALLSAGKKLGLK
jgi:uncharacterized protein YdeI (YjbR/CyaY-like superfamily)